MKKVVAISVVLAVTAGCNTPKVGEAKQDAYKRWYETRAQLLCGLAEEHYQAGEMKKAKGRLNEVLSLAPENRQGRVLLAKMHIGEGAYPLAMSILTKLDADHPDSPEILYLLGVAQEKRGLLADALVSYRRSQELDESNPSPVIAAAEVLVSQNKLRQAQLYVESYMSVAGSDPAMYEIAGRIAMMTEDYATSAEHYQKACDLDPENRCYAEALSKSLFFAGKYWEAAEKLEELTSKESADYPAWAFTMLGDCHMEMDLTNEARRSYHRASELSPGSPGCWANLSKALLAIGDLPRAIDAARRALRLDANCADASILLGYAMLRDGQVPAALAVLERAAERHPENADLRCILGRVHEVAGRREGARRCYSEALRIDPSNDLARELLGEHVSAAIGMD